MDDGGALNTGSGRELGCLMLEPSSQRLPAPIAAWPTVDEDRFHASVSTARASVAMGSDVHHYTETGGSGLLDESRLTERIVERCLETEARIIPVESAAAQDLAEANGIGGLLRW
jgi:hypothetical protein